MHQTIMKELPIACTLTDAAFQQRRAGVLQRIQERVQSLKPLDTGYALQFAADEAVLEDVFRLIQLERQCCAFLQFELTIEPDHGPVWLSLTGPDGTKAFLENVLGLPGGS